VTRTLDADRARLREHFAVAAFPDGGLLLHLFSGDFFELDRVRAAVWRAIVQATATEEVVDVIASALAIPRATAFDIVERTVAQGLALENRPPDGIPRFEDDTRVLSLRDRAGVLLTFDRQALRLHLGPGLILQMQAGRNGLEEALRVFVPKILGSWYPLALHASAVQMGTRTLLFSGDSGAGKTTTARLLVEEMEATRLIAEDMVLLSDLEDEASIVVGAEAAVHAWMADATQTLSALQDQSVDVEQLLLSLRAQSGRLPLRKIVFLDSARRTGAAWRFGSLTSTATLRLLFVNSFIHSSTFPVLRSHLDACGTLTSRLVAAEALAIPFGLTNLRAGLRAQIETIAS
jgi:hypothetical protein